MFGYSPIFAIFFECFESLQLLSFPFRAHAHFPWNHEHTNWFIALVSASVPETLLRGNATAFYVVLVSLGLVLFNAGLVGYYFSKSQYKFVWTLRYLRIVCTMFMTILYIPVIELFSSMLVSCSGDDHSEASAANCWAGTLALRSTVVVIVSLLYAALTLTFALTVFQQDPTDATDLHGRPHSRIELYHILSKTILTIVFSALEHDSKYWWILALTCIVTSFSSTFLYSWFLPFYNWRFSVFRALLQSIFAWASVCLAIVMFINDAEHNSISIMFFLMAPFVMMVVYYGILLRRKQIKRCVMSPSMSAFTVELKTRFMLEDNGFLDKKHGKPMSTENPEAGDKAENNRLILGQITDLYTEASNVLPNSSILYMFWSIFALYHCNNKQRSLVVLAECLKRNPLIDEEFVVFRQRKIMNEESSSENVDMLEFIICESHMKKAARHERKAVNLQLRFWQELAQVRPNLQELFVLGSSVNAEVSLADLHYSKAMMSNAKSSNVLRSYARFLNDVCNDPKRSEELFERAQQLDEIRRRANALNDGGIDLANLIANGASDVDSAIVTIDHKGTILSANAGVRHLFGYEKPQQLVGENVSILVPSPFDKIHTDFLTRFLNVGEGQIIAKLRKIFAIRFDGYLIPVSSKDINT